MSYVTFKGSSAANITAPLAGAFTPDNKLFFVSTAGDNMIHYISVPLVTTNPANADTQQISPNLPACTPISSGGTDPGCAYSGPSPAPPSFRPRSSPSSRAPPHSAFSPASRKAGHAPAFLLSADAPQMLGAPSLSRFVCGKGGNLKTLNSPPA